MGNLAACQPTIACCQFQWIDMHAPRGAKLITSRLVGGLDSNMFFEALGVITDVFLWARVSFFAVWMELTGTATGYVAMSGRGSSRCR